MKFLGKKPLRAIEMGVRPDGGLLYRCTWCGRIIAREKESCQYCSNPLDFDNAVKYKGRGKEIERFCGGCSHFTVCNMYITPLKACGLWDGWHNILENPNDTPKYPATVNILTTNGFVYVAQMNEDGALVVPDAVNGIEGDIEKWKYV